MSEFTVTLPSGKVWTPKFVSEINQDKCIGCGRCFKVCGRDVLTMVGINEDGEVIPVSLDDEDDDELWCSEARHGPNGTPPCRGPGTAAGRATLRAWPRRSSAW